ncbi:MAG: hypothetical protein GTN76_09640 [Candidatus Aenigmarchaeota archaeon]|nr:hypothetical protein [Candidatus Aenigmarchaeota archaeon]
MPDQACFFDKFHIVHHLIDTSTKPVVITKQRDIEHSRQTLVTSGSRMPGTLRINRKPSQATENPDFKINRAYLLKEMFHHFSFHENRYRSANIWKIGSAGQPILRLGPIRGFA